jgi:hypothetical protein
LAGCLLLLPAIARAECRVEVVGPESSLWRQAASLLGGDAGGHAVASHCSAVLVEAADGLGKLTFTVNDGRTARRDLEDPLELVPTVQALSIEGPAPEPAAAVAASDGRRTPARVPADRADARPVAVTQKGYELNPLWGAQIGFRAGADHLITPCVGAFGAVPLDRWELGILARYEAHYVSTLGGNEGAPETSTAVFGVTAGRRDPLGNFVMRSGLTGLLAAVHEEGGGKRGQAEARLGAYGGAVLPLSRRVGLRADLAFEVVPYSIGHSQSNAIGSSSLPWWGLTSVVGLEIN